jgi:hypothetical protein
LGAGLSGAAGGLAAGGPTGAIIGGVGSLLGGLFGNSTPKIPKELKRLYDMQYGLAQQQQQFSQSIPLSSPQEQAALASQRGLLGDQQRQQMGTLESQYDLVNQGTNGVGDFLSNLNNQYQGQQSAMTADALQNALLARRQAIGQAGQLAQGAGSSVQYQQQTPLGPGFGELARLIAYNQTLHANTQQQQGQAQRPNGGPQLNTPDMSHLPTAGVQSPPAATPAGAGGLTTPDMTNLPGMGMRNPFTAASLVNPALAQITPGLSAQATALNR